MKPFLFQVEITTTYAPPAKPGDKHSWTFTATLPRVPGFVRKSQFGERACVRGEVLHDTVPSPATLREWVLGAALRDLFDLCEAGREKWAEEDGQVVTIEELATGEVTRVVPR